jgi:hypothetical protein
MSIGRRMGLRERFRLNHLEADYRRIEERRYSHEEEFRCPYRRRRAGRSIHRKPVG